MIKKIKNYKSLLNKIKSRGNWHFDPQKKSNDAKYLGRLRLSKSVINKAIKSVKKKPLVSCVSIFKKDFKNYKKSQIAWGKMDNLQIGYQKSNTLFKQVIYSENNIMPDWCKKIISKSKLQNAYLSVNMNPPGSINPWHFDTYQNMKSKYNIKNNSKKIKIQRILIFLENWHWGHFLQVGNSVITNWKAGDCYTWNYQKYHLACNAGIKPRYVVAITGLTKNNVKY